MACAGDYAVSREFSWCLRSQPCGTRLQKGLWSLETIDLRLFGVGKHRNVDDTPAGGGAGMVLRADVISHALEHALKREPDIGPLIYLSPRGRPFDQAMAKNWSTSPGVRLLCGRFEGVDQRVLDHYGIQEVSLGDFVLSGGEIAAQAMIDAVSVCSQAFWEMRPHCKRRAIQMAY